MVYIRYTELVAALNSSGSDQRVPSIQPKNVKPILYKPAIPTSYLILFSSGKPLFIRGSRYMIIPVRYLHSL